MSAAASSAPPAGARAVVVDAPGAPWSLREVEVPAPTGSQVLVDVEAVGLCHADLAARTGAFPVPLPAVLGHEGTGTVRAVGPGATRTRVGDRVVLSYDACRSCAACSAGWPTRCEHYTALNFGAQGDRPLGWLGSPRSVGTGDGPVFSSFFGQSTLATCVVVEERSAVVVRSDLPAELLAPLGCSVQTGAGAVLNVARPGVGAVVAVVGLGPVGFSALTAAARFTPATRVVAVDLDADRLALAGDLGADGVVDAGAPDAARALAALGVDVVVECSGSPAALAPALAALRPGGTAVLVGAPPFGTTVPVDVAALVNRSTTVRGTVEGDGDPATMVPWLAAMVAAGRWPLERLVTTYPLDEIAEAADAMGAGRVVKPVLLPA